MQPCQTVLPPVSPERLSCRSRAASGPAWSSPSGRRQRRPSSGTSGGERVELHMCPADPPKHKVPFYIFLQKTDLVLAVFKVDWVSCDPSSLLFSFWYNVFLTTCKLTFLLSLLHASSDTLERSKRRKRISLKKSKRNDFLCQNEARTLLLKAAEEAEIELKKQETTCWQKPKDSNKR